ncbi:uncharacterized protein LOC127848608 [Dreissena polymorpha]|uniref:Uncharacterized protein n=1 Tax=Dreissena polymorpha TaxID=45954 RepID=A0A9D4DSP6_DREPO|nr:uncharacterized protein LOC127848608 [Dreissena polymorpha]KAH3753930.1 hypothetical protein DPMN_188583 [Dreissena polymorpha]
MGETCSKTRILSMVVVVLALVLVAVVVAFIYRETRGRRRRTELNENNVKALYPVYFRDQEEQDAFQESFFESFYSNRTVIKPTVDSEQACSFNCTFYPVRQKRMAQNGVQHGCCISNARFHFPTNHTNIKGQVRTFLQFGTKKQYFTVHACTALIGCTGCVCSQEKNFAPAVVLKIGVQKVDDIEDTEIDYFSFPGCCKCINT